MFPGLFGQPSAILVPSENESSGQALKVGVVLSGGQAPGGHNVISGIFGKDLSTCIYSGSISCFFFFWPKFQMVFESGLQYFFVRFRIVQSRYFR